MCQDRPLNRAMGGGGVAASIKKSIASGILQSTETTKTQAEGETPSHGFSLRITQMEQYARGCLCPLGSRAFFVVSFCGLCRTPSTWTSSPRMPIGLALIDVDLSSTIFQNNHNNHSNHCNHSNLSHLPSRGSLLSDLGAKSFSCRSWKLTVSREPLDGGVSGDSGSSCDLNT